ncbi:hypothetical protein SLEP1_g36279 [Rubroshorea leprosula]|uniref:XS domain-containing protein n=1 Tax=Rubroshorea leprosula TaxID=152421 RepID=A0AAV5KR04_9ROSI|nr:hypothetical protein SLEP1_g36279 [Rubroshorea leprosula]
MGIVTNIYSNPSRRWKGCRGKWKKLKEEFTRQGFNPLKVHPLWNRKGHSGFAIVEFNKEWDCLKNVIVFEKSFESNHYGKRDYYSSRHQGEKLYGWIARDDDYYSRNLIGDYLCKHRDLKTVSGKEAEDAQKAIVLVSSLTNTLKTKNMHLKEIKSKYIETSVAVNKVIDEKEKIIIFYNEGGKRQPPLTPPPLPSIPIPSPPSPSDTSNPNNTLKLETCQEEGRELQNRKQKKGKISCTSLHQPTPLPCTLCCALTPCSAPAPSPRPDPLCSAPLTLLAAILCTNPCTNPAPACAPAQPLHQPCTFLFAPLHACTSLTPLHQPRAPSATSRPAPGLRHVPCWLQSSAPAQPASA